MEEAIFKETFLEDEVKVGEGEVVTPANMIPLIGTAWVKRGNQEEGGKEHLVKLIAKVLWRGYHEHATIVIELLKKEYKRHLLKLFGKKGELQEWTEKKGIKMRHTKIEVFLEENKM